MKTFLEASENIPSQIYDSLETGKTFSMIVTFLEAFENISSNISDSSKNITERTPMFSSISEEKIWKLLKTFLLTFMTHQNSL